MMVQLQDVEDKAVTFEKASNLKGKKNPMRKAYYINDDMLEEDKEYRNFYRSLLRENDTQLEDDKLKITLKKGKLRVNNEPVKEKITVPTPADILTLDARELDELHKLKTHDAGEHEEGRSEFLCQFQRVKTENEVQKGLAKMKVKYGDAAHTVVAYRLNNPAGPYRQGFNDDHEHGAGWRMLEELKEKKDENLAVFITRFSDGSKMGPRRFDVYRDPTKRAVKKYRIKKDRLDRINRLNRSQSQLSQLSADEANDPVLQGSTENIHTDPEILSTAEV